MGGELASDQIKGLNPIGTLVDLGDAGVTRILLHTVLPYVSVTTVNLDPQVGGLHPDVGECRLGNWGQQRQQIVSRFTRFRIGMTAAISSCLATHAPSARAPSV